METKHNPEVGCYFDHGCRNVEELAQDIVDLAREFGFKPKPMTEEECEDPEAWDWAEEEAIEFLNDNVCPEGCYWGHDGYAGAFGLWRIEE